MLELQKMETFFLLFFHFLATKKEWSRRTSKWIVFCQLLIVSSNTNGANKGTGRCCVLWTYLGARAHRNRTDKKDPSRFVSKFWCLSYTDQRRTKKLWVWQCYVFALLFLCSESNTFPFPSNQTNKEVKTKKKKKNNKRRSDWSKLRLCLCVNAAECYYTVTW